MRTKIDGEAVQPSGEGGLAAEAADLAEEMEEGFLGHVFGLRDVAEHAEAEGVDAAFVKGVELGEGLGVAVLGRLDGFGFADDGRISFKETLGGFRWWDLGFVQSDRARFRGHRLLIA